MSFSLQVASGDLVLSGSQMGIVYGANKLNQDLTLWLAERYGIDKSHPTMGSYFENYIGSFINNSTQAMIYNEAMRVLNNYQSVQGQAFQQTPQLFSLAELLYAINSVNVSITYDVVTVAVSVANAQGQTTTITTTSSAS
jgi:hypothetical protein